MGIPKENLNGLWIGEITDLEVLKNAGLANFFSRSVMELRFNEIGLSVHLPTILHILHEHIEHEDKTVIVAMDGKRYVGILMGSILNFPFTMNKMITDVLFRVDQDYRGDGVGHRLVQAFKAWGKSKGAMLVMIGINQYVGRDANESTAAMDCMGFKIFNHNYAMRI